MSSSSYILAKTDPRSSRTVSLRQLSLLYVTVNRLYKAMRRMMSVAGSEDQERHHAFLRLTKRTTDLSART